MQWTYWCGWYRHVSLACGWLSIICSGVSWIVEPGGNLNRRCWWAHRSSSSTSIVLLYLTHRDWEEITAATWKSSSQLHCIEWTLRSGAFELGRMRLDTPSTFLLVDLALLQHRPWARKSCIARTTASRDSIDIDVSWGLRPWMSIRSGRVDPRQSCRTTVHHHKSSGIQQPSGFRNPARDYIVLLPTRHGIHDRTRLTTSTHHSRQRTRRLSLPHTFTWRHAFSESRQETGASNVTVLSP